MARKKYFLILLSVSIILLIRFFYFYQNQEIYENGQRVEFEARLSEEPQLKFGKQQFRLKDDKGQKITIITGLSPMYQYGDRINVSGAISQKDYSGHTFTSINFPTIQIVKNDQNFITRLSTYIRRRTKSLYDKTLPNISSSLLTGIVFGGNQGMPDKFMQDLRVSGVVHVIAASGMNVTFVAGALMSVFGAIFRRQIALTIAILGIIFYAFLAGFEPSIVRAAIMAAIAFSAQLLGKQSYSVAAIFLTGSVMLLFQPNLLTDVGFQLSFLATFGILVIKPLIDKVFEKFGALGRLMKDDVGTTISAQITTVPILMAVFGSYGLLSVLVNALVLWTVPVLMVLGALGLIFGLIFEPLGKIFLFPAVPILFYFESVVTYFGGFGLNLEIPSVSPLVWIGYYLIISGLVINLSKVKPRTGQKP